MVCICENGRAKNNVSICDGSPYQYRGSHKVLWENLFECSERHIHVLHTKIEKFRRFLKKPWRYENGHEKIVCVYVMVRQHNTEVLIKHFEKRIGFFRRQIHGLIYTKNWAIYVIYIKRACKQGNGVKASVRIRDGSPTQYGGPHKYL